MRSEPTENDDFAGDRLSGRARNLLRRLGVRSPAELAALTADEVAASRGCGLTTLNELREALARRGLSFNEGRRTPATIRWRPGPPPQEPDGAYPRLVAAQIATVDGTETPRIFLAVYVQRRDGSLAPFGDGRPAHAVTFLRHFVIPPAPG